MRTNLFDKWCFITTVATLLFSWSLFWSYTGEPIGSFTAAIIASGLVFLAYIVFRMVYLAFRE